MDLSAWRGKTIVLHLEADPGPAGAPDYDWGRFVRPQIAVQDDTPPALQPLGFAGFARPQKVLAAEGEVEMTSPPAKPGEKAEIQARCRLPNTLIVPITAPGEAMLPVNLLQARYSSHVLFADGVEQASYSYFGGSVGEAKCGGQNRPACLCIRRPRASRWRIGG